MAKITKQQWESNVKQAGAGRYEFVRWAVDGKYGSNNKCVVKCVIDGFSWASTVNNLVDKLSGCPHCSGNRRWTAEERIEQINKLENIIFVSWGGEYKNRHSMALVRCLVDNYEWSAEVNSLVNGGYGCPHCSGKRIWTAEERIGQINNIENIEFVSWVDGYKNCYSKANLRCSVDGFLWIASVDNLVNGGRGCPSCAKSGYDQSKIGTLYALRSECGQYVKVGISNDPKRRHNELEKRTPFKFNIVEQISGDGAKIAELEKHFHNKYERAGFTGFDGCTEWLVCTPELLEELRNLGDQL